MRSAPALLATTVLSLSLATASACQLFTGPEREDLVWMGSVYAYAGSSDWVAVSGAQVSATHIHSQVTVSTTTNDTGNFELVISPADGSLRVACGGIQVAITAEGYAPFTAKLSAALGSNLGGDLSPRQDCPGDGRVYSGIGLFPEDWPD